MIKLEKTLKSSEDNSVNFIFKGDFPGFLEARYVRRKPEYFSLYISSQSGCKQGCRQCHLTATKQTDLINADITMMHRQATTVLKHYEETEEKANRVHFNFMARGEPLLNPRIDDYFLSLLGSRARDFGLSSRFCISTIMPKEIKGKKLTDLFSYMQPDFYYSIYSINTEFRQRWLPNAMDVDEALDMLYEWQRNTGKIVKLHWPFIKGENDSWSEVAGIASKVLEKKLRVNINIVRYNPFSDKHGEESDLRIILTNLDLLRSMLPESTVKLVSRVGTDVFASCGTFTV